MSEFDFYDKLKEVTNPLPGSIPYSANYKLSVKLKHEGITLIDLYTNLFPNVPSNEWIKKINNGLLKVNGQRSNPAMKLNAGWITENIVHNKVEPNVSSKIELIYQDENVLVVSKPSPLPMHPSGRFNKNTLIEILKLIYPNLNLKVVHRLDANTTGTVILAKNRETATNIGRQFQSNTIEKDYYALVEGAVQKESQIVSQNIGSEKTIGGSRELSNNGKFALTKIQVIQRNFKDNTTLLRVQPKNGRTNQIRLHLSSIGHPIVGDFGYKEPNYFKNNPMTYDSDCLYLHAQSITLDYNGNRRRFTSELPKKFLS